jgi:hypothetical protein
MVSRERFQQKWIPLCGSETRQFKDMERVFFFAKQDALQWTRVFAQTVHNVKTPRCKCPHPDVKFLFASGESFSCPEFAL